MLIRLIRGAFGISRRDRMEAARQNDAAIAHAERGEIDSALAAFRRAAELDPKLLAARLNLANLLFQHRADYRGALAVCQAALRLSPGNLEALRLSSLALYEIGEVARALELLASTDTARDDATCLHYRAFMENALVNHDSAGHFALHRDWAHAFARENPLAQPATTEARATPTGGLIKVGFVSAEFREHAVASFLLPAIEGHDAQRFQVFCYSNSGVEDRVTRRFRAARVTWHDIAAMSDDAVAQLIRSEELDVLIDCSGHTRGHRLGVFARRLAPVQCAWLGYFNTCGLTTIDYRLTDANFDPIGASENFHTEKLLRLDRSAWCYRPAPDAPDIGAAPHERARVITFGSFNHIAKINDDVIALWSRLLIDTPGSILKIAALPDRETTERLFAAFEKNAVHRSRLRPLSRLPRAAFLAEIERTDIALDPFPYSGGATTCDCLWMGVPVVALAGDFGFARSAAAALAPAELAQLIAQSPKEYLRIAKDLADGGLSPWRRSMRERLLSSPLMDEAGFRARFYSALGAHR